MLTVFFCLATIWSSQHHQLHGFGQHQVCKHLKWFSVCLLPPCGKTIFFILLVLAETGVLTTCSVVMVLTSIAKHVCVCVCVWELNNVQILCVCVNQIILEMSFNSTVSATFVGNSQMVSVTYVTLVLWRRERRCHISDWRNGISPERSIHFECN